MIRGATRRRRQPLSAIAAAALALVATACSEESDAPDSLALQNRPPPVAPSASAGSSGDAAPSEAAPPTAPETPLEGNPAPAGPVQGAPGNAPSAGSNAPDAAVPAGEGADAGVASEGPGPGCARELTDANVATVTSAIDELFVQGDIGAVDRYWAEPYLQHNPIAASGVATFRNLFGGLISPNQSIYELSRVIGECELVLIHGNYTSFGGPTFDMFRVDAGRIVEHWDAAATGAGPNASGHTALDGPSSVEDVALGSENEALVLGFVDAVLIGGGVDAIDGYMSPDLIEHDPESVDGSAAFVQNLAQRAISYRQVHHSISDGNFVFVLSEGAVGGADVAHYDLFRVATGRIAEHWNGRRTVPATTQSGLGIF